jgi:hypothetical protein
VVKLVVACTNGALIGLHGSKSNLPNFITNSGGVSHSMVVFFERSKVVSIIDLFISSKKLIKIILYNTQ